MFSKHDLNQLELISLHSLFEFHDGKYLCYYVQQNVVLTCLYDTAIGGIQFYLFIFAPQIEFVDFKCELKDDFVKH